MAVKCPRSQRGEHGNAGGGRGRDQRFRGKGWGAMAESRRRGGAHGEASSLDLVVQRRRSPWLLGLVGALA